MRQPLRDPVIEVSRNKGKGVFAENDGLQRGEVTFEERRIPKVQEPTTKMDPPFNKTPKEAPPESPVKNELASSGSPYNSAKHQTGKVSKQKERRLKAYLNVGTVQAASTIENDSLDIRVPSASFGPSFVFKHEELNPYQQEVLPPVPVEKQRNLSKIAGLD